MSQRSFNQTLALLKETHPAENFIPEDYYRTLKLVSKHGLSTIKIDCCINRCMLFYSNEDKQLTECRFCHKPHYKTKRVGRGKHKDVPVNRMHYLSLIPRVRRLYASMSSAPHMRWHFENKRKEELLCHPSDREAWKHFDETFPNFAVEPRNVRLGLCADGFTPYGQSGKPYSCWPVIVTSYNLPPELCMTTPYMFLTLIILGPKNPKEKIDVYL